MSTEDWPEWMRRVQYKAYASFPGVQMEKKVNVLNPPPEKELTFEEWYAEFSSLVMTLDKWARNDGDPGSRDNPRDRMLRLGRKRLRDGGNDAT